MRQWIDLFEDGSEPEPSLYSDPERAAAFNALAQGQRGAPEMAMLRVQDANLGGLVSYLVEHVGDLTHRTAEYPTHPDFHSGYELVEPKVRRSLRMLTTGYGFEREISENDTANARARNQTVEEFRKKLDYYLSLYALEHSKLRVYNRAQWLAREAAIMLGKRQWKQATRHLAELSDYLVDIDTWDNIAAPYDPDFDNIAR